MKKGYKFTPYDYAIRNWDSPKDKESLAKNGRVARLSVKYTTMIKVNKFGGKCAICGENDLNLLDLHHIVEVCDGGHNHIDNMICVCANDHRRVHAKMRQLKVA